MGKKLQQEIKQSRPFHSLEEEALLNISRTADAMHRALQQVIKPYGLTQTQYNALRILRGAGPEGLRCSEVGERLVNQDPDITRLMDRLERQKLVRRRRSQADRRVVHTLITELGLKHLAELDPVIQRTAKLLLRGLNREQMEELIELLEEARTGTGRPGVALRTGRPGNELRVATPVGRPGADRTGVALRVTPSVGRR